MKGTGGTACVPAGCRDEGKACGLAGVDGVREAVWWKGIRVLTQPSFPCEMECARLCCMVRMAMTGLEFGVGYLVLLRGTAGAFLGAQVCTTAGMAAALAAATSWCCLVRQRTWCARDALIRSACSCDCANMQVGVAGLLGCSTASHGTAAGEGGEGVGGCAMFS